MPSSGNKVRIGPWTQGLNLSDNQELISPDALSSIINFDVDNDGTLQPRRAMRAPLDPAGISLTGQTRLIGTHISNTGTTDETIAPLVIKLSDGTTYKYSLKNNTWTQNGSWKTNWTGNVVWYNGVPYFIPDLTTAAGSGGYSNSAFTVTTTVASIPQGNEAFVFKDRLFVVGRNGTNNSSVIYWSKATDPTTWSAPDGGFFTIPQEYVNKVLIQSDNMVIFTANSTYVFNFSLDPAIDGVLRVVSRDTGALAATIYNNVIYLFNNRSVYRFTNLSFQDIGSAIPFVDNSYYPGYNQQSVFIVGETLYVFLTLYNATSGVVSYKFYALNTITNAWSEYKFAFFMDSSSQKPLLCRDAKGAEYIYLQTNNYAFYVLKNRFDEIGSYRAAADIIPVTGGFKVVFPEYSFNTKKFVQFLLGRYILGSDEEWKRLYWWSLKTPAFDPTVKSSTNFFGTATPTPLLHVDSQLSGGQDTLYNGSFDSNIVSRVVTPSLRFRGVKFGYSQDVVVNPTVYSNFTNMIDAYRSFQGPSFRNILAYVGFKKNVSQ